MTSRWLDFRKMPSWSYGIAREDCEDLMAADAVIIFTEIPNTVLATGGRHVEFGLALAQGKRVIVVGPRENVFHYLLPESQVFATWNQAFATIRHQHKSAVLFFSRTDSSFGKQPIEPRSRKT